MDKIKRFGVYQTKDGMTKLEGKHERFVYYSDHAAEVERLNNRIADLELELEQENASSRVYMDKTDAEIAALTKALDEATSRVVTIDKATDAYVRKHGNFTVVHDYERLSPASRALCERMFGGAK